MSAFVPLPDIFRPDFDPAAAGTIAWLTRFVARRWGTRTFGGWRRRSFEKPMNHVLDGDHDYCSESFPGGTPVEVLTLDDARAWWDAETRDWPTETRPTVEHMAAIGQVVVRLGGKVRLARVRAP